MAENLKKRFICLSCEKKGKLKRVIKLGNHSFADRFLPEKKLKVKDPSYPLNVLFCKNCYYLQSEFITKPKERYSVIDYSYTSSNSKISMEHWRKFYKYFYNKYKLKGKKVLEIGSNDGYLSNLFNKNCKTVCVDASPVMTRLSKKLGIKSYNMIFDKKKSLFIKKKFQAFDLIIANNVFNHANNPKDFINGVKNLLSDSGKFVFEQPYFAHAIKNYQFDQIYHEHISYFTILNLENFLKFNGFKIIKISLVNYHGISIRVEACLNKNKMSKPFNYNSLKKDEIKIGINKVVTYKLFMNKIKKEKKNFQNKIKDYIKKGYQIIGIGAPAKGNTILTYFKLNTKKMKFICEASKYKIGKFTPISRIPIVSDDKLSKTDKKIICIVLNWNIKSFVIKKLKKINPKLKFLTI